MPLYDNFHPGGPLLLNLGDAPAVAPAVLRRVWRTSLDQPGFAFLRFVREVSSRELRQAMVELVDAFPVRFVPERFGRFDQQVSRSSTATVRAHVAARFGLATTDRRAAGSGSRTPLRLPFTRIYRWRSVSHRAQPVFLVRRNSPFITELDLPHGKAFIVVINNSLLPFDPG